MQWQTEVIKLYVDQNAIDDIIMRHFGEGKKLKKMICLKKKDNQSNIYI